MTVEAPEVKEPPRITVVTPDNFDQYVNESLGVLEVAAQEAEATQPVIEAVEEEAHEDVDHPDKGKKEKLNKRFSELTTARKEAIAKAEAAETALAAERAARAALEAERNELKNKYEPPKTEPDPEPQPAQFTDINEYSKALKEWTADNTRREDAAKAVQAQREQEHAKVVETWKERQEATKKAIPDYAEKIAASSVQVSDQMRDAIIESDIGPEMLYHFATNPDVATKLAEMPTAKMLREFVRLEASLGGAGKPPTKSAQNAVAEISKAPAPISPLRGASAPVAAKVDGKGEFFGTYEEFKAARQSGKIK